MIIKAKRMKSIADVLEEVEVLIDTLYFDDFSETKSSMFLKKIIGNQSVIDTRLPKKVLENIELYPQDDEGHTGDSGKPPLGRQEEGDDNEEES